MNKPTAEKLLRRYNWLDAVQIKSRVEAVLAMTSVDEDEHGQWAVGWNDCLLAVKKNFDGVDKS